MGDAGVGEKPQNKYEVLRHLGSGGMAEVLLARQVGAAGFEKPVALKRLLPQSASDQGYIRSLINEARLASGLSHPNIVQVFDFERIDGFFCLVMEYIEGMTLEEALNGCRLDGQHLPTELLAFIAMEAASGLAYLHDALAPDGSPLNLVHRDIKPSNLMLSKQGQVKLLDLGVAKSSSNLYRTTVGSGAKGTLAFMSPEQLSGEQVDATSDLFSLGVTLYEAATLQPLFDDKNIVKLSQQMYQGLRPGRKETLQSLFPALVPVLERLLQPEPEKRYASALDLRAVLRAHAQGMGAPELAAWLKQVRPVKTEAISQGATAMYDADSVFELKAVLQKHASEQGIRPAQNEQGPPAAPPRLALSPPVTGLVLSPMPAKPEKSAEQSISGDITVQSNVPLKPKTPAPGQLKLQAPDGQPFKANSGGTSATRAGRPEPMKAKSDSPASPSTQTSPQRTSPEAPSSRTAPPGTQRQQHAPEASPPVIAEDHSREAQAPLVEVSPPEDQRRAGRQVQSRGLPRTTLVFLVTGALAVLSLAAFGVALYQQHRADPLVLALEEGASVSITSMPRGTIYIGGRDRGPSYSGLLKPGMHRVQIRAPNGEQKVFKIDARVGEQLEYVWSFQEQRWLKGSD